MSRMMAQIKAWWKAEKTRHFLWLPVCFASGIGLYYGLPVEPAVYVFPACAAVALLLTVFLGARLRPVMLALLLVMLGASWANMATLRAQPVVLREGLTPRPVVGVVRDIEPTEHGVRLTLENVIIDDLPAAQTPARVRLSVRLKKGSELALPRIGDGIGLRAGLLPPMGPALPESFDFARYFSFRGIGAVGYGLPPWKIIAPDPSPSLANDFLTWRVRLTDDIIKTLGPSVGSIGAGLITGEARAISKEDFNALRASNLYHIIAISGEHMVVIAGVIFISLRLLALALLPSRISLRPGVKSLAAWVTLLLVTAYLFVTGLPISAVRAYVMIVLVLLAVILRRQVDPMRSLSIAALLMLVYNPANLLDPGFQLSFAATLAIIALVEARMLAPHPAIERGRVRNAIHLIGTMLLVSVVAEGATAPLVIAMFNNVSPYGVFANSVATPLVSLFLMPLVALFFILLPLGLHHWALHLLGYGIKGLLTIAHFFAELPYAQLFCPSIPGYGVALFSLGLAWLCLWKTRARRYGAIPMLLGVATLLTVQLPDMLVGTSLKQIAFRSEHGYVLARGRASSMMPQLWANGLGYKELPKAETPQWRCDGLGCIADVGTARVAFPKDAVALANDCRAADIVITSFSGARCDSAARVIDGEALKAGAVTALWLKDGKLLRTETSADWQGQRPWSAAADEEEE
ncbi:MAG: ComEC/Rec2 family competence protein [Pseudomonadota bacterium]